MAPILMAALLGAAIAVAGSVGPAPAKPAHPAALCREAAIAAARRHGVPAEIMRAITLTETRRRVAGHTGPWPWTLNIAGEGLYFGRREAALARARRAIERGERSVDIGCFQINYRWHGAKFPSIEAMMAPRAAADYAARWMAELHAETGDWLRAAGHYHSRTPRHAARYRRAIARSLAEIGADPARLARAEPAAAVAPRMRASRRPTPARDAAVPPPRRAMPARLAGLLAPGRPGALVTRPRGAAAASAGEPGRPRAAGGVGLGALGRGAAPLLPHRPTRR
jgi:hypothetical protein